MNTHTIRLALALCITLQPYNIQAAHNFIPACIKKFSKTTTTLLGALASGLALKTFISTDVKSAHEDDSRCYWDWSTIDPSTTQFPEGFMFGAGTSSFQVEGDSSNTDWWHWEEGNYADGTPHVQSRSGKASDHWHRYKEDIALMAQMGMHTFRFSIAWDKVQPHQDEFDQEAIDHYKQVIAECKKHGIKPLIGLHHYTDPVWFADMGAFEQEENITYFVAFCRRMMEELGDDAWMWSTFNSPSGYAFHKYHIGDFPPGEKDNTQKTMEVYKNMCEAHVQVYQAAKKIDPAIQVGILKNIIHMDPWRTWHPIDQHTSSIAEQLQDDCFFAFFSEGTFDGNVTAFGMKKLTSVTHSNPDAPHSLDFIGCNYYGHAYIKNITKFNAPFETQTQNPTYTIYPEGLYRAIKKLHDHLVAPIEKRTGKKIPIYVTENGIASDNEQDRLTFFSRYLYALAKAIHDGYDVRGYIPWSLLDNYEWRGGTDVKYGLVAVDFAHGTLDRTIKADAGTQYYLDLIKRTQQAPEQAMATG